MKLIKTFSVLTAITALTLIYIHMQTQIFDMAYRGKNREQEIMDLTSYNGMVTSEIMALKSSNYLGPKLLTDESDLQFCDQQDIVHVALATEEPTPLQRPPAQLRTHPLLSLLSLRSEAQAQQIETRPMFMSWSRR